MILQSKAMKYNHNKCQHNTVQILYCIMPTAVFDRNILNLFFLSDMNFRDSDIIIADW